MTAMRSTHALLMAALLTLPGCALVRSAQAPSAEAPLLRIVADAEANGRRPVALDVVRAGDAAMASRLDGLDAASWFRERPALHGAGGQRIAITSWEMVPGQSVVLNSLPPFAATPVATYVYALYATPGLHRLRVDGGAPIALRLGRDDLALAPPAGGAP